MTEIISSNISKPLKSVIERIENLTAEKEAIADDIREVFRGAKGDGLDPKTIRKMLALRRLDAAQRAEQEFLRDTYLRALGLIDDMEE